MRRLAEKKQSEIKSVPGGLIGMAAKFADLNRLILRDLNKNSSNPVQSKYSKDNVAKYVANPAQYEKQLREAINYVYANSPHFRRLIQYFAGLSDLAYVVTPYKLNPLKANVNSIGRNYRRTVNALSNMSIRSQFAKVLTVCLREDVFYGTLWVTNDNITVQQLPSDYCKISAIEGNVLNVTFDFSYFNTNTDKLPFYPQEFNTKYELYLKNRMGSRWQELDSPTSFAIKCSNDILSYAIPPFAGILREVYDLEDYKDLKLAKTTLENYAMLVMKLGMADDGSWQMDFDEAEKFWRNLDAVLPDEVGSVLTPMPIEKISFEKTHAGDDDTIGEAEQNIFTAAGVSSLLFNNDKASANALLLSIKADQAITFGIVKSIEDAINRFIQDQPYGKNFRVAFLDISPFNRKEMSDSYLKACQYGIPMISYYAAAQGLNQAELDGMSFLENKVLELPKLFTPLQSSAQMSSGDSNGATDEGGAHEKDIGELSDSGEQSREDGDDWG